MSINNSIINTNETENVTVNVTIATIKDGGYVTLCGTMDYDEIDWNEMENVTHDGWMGWGDVYAETATDYETIYIVR